MANFEPMNRINTSAPVVPDIHSSLGALECGLDSLQDRLGALALRLKPILKQRNVVAGPPAGGEADAAMSDVRLTVEKMRGTVDGVTAQIATLLNDLEV